MDMEGENSEQEKEEQNIETGNSNKQSDQRSPHDSNNIDNHDANSIDRRQSSIGEESSLSDKVSNLDEKDQADDQGDNVKESSDESPEEKADEEQKIKSVDGNDALQNGINAEQDDDKNSQEKTDRVNHGMTNGDREEPTNDQQNDHGTDVKNDDGQQIGQQDQTAEADKPPDGSGQVSKPKRKRRRNIFISYSLDAPFTERKLVAETVKQLKELGFHEDLWYDKDEIEIDSPLCFSIRMEQSERCKAAVLFLSSSYFHSRASFYEYNTLIQRHRLATTQATPSDTRPIKLCVIICEPFNFPNDISYISSDQVILRLDGNSMSRLSIAEKASAAIGTLTKVLEPFCSGIATRLPTPPSRHGLSDSYKVTKLLKWSVDDVQEWLTSLQIHERYMMTFEEYRIDGYLLSCLTDDDLIQQFGIDSRITRKKLLQKIRVELENEVKSPNNWYLRWHWARIRDNSVYIIYDPMDKKVVRSLVEDLSKKHYQILAHDKLGRSKEEFIRFNGHRLAVSKHVVIVLTATSAASPFVYQEVLLADWLGKTPISMVFHNCYNNMKLSLRSILNDRSAVDFQHTPYNDAMDVLFFKLHSGSHLHGVYLQQDYIERVNDNMKTLQSIGSPEGQSFTDKDPVVFISYQWDSQSKVVLLKEQLEANGIPCWIDRPNITINKNQMSSHTGHNRTSGMASSLSNNMTNIVTDTIQSEIQRVMKNCKVVLCCMTPKYTRSDNFYKDLALADSLSKPILPVMLHFMPWPPEIAALHLRKNLASLEYIDISSEKLFRRNFATVINQIQRHQSQTMAVPKLPPLK
ncbi:uncharacterized protein TRIADDRAFT_58085 [Trichoplax adhaerens]|uniref:Uncharacterized protein n=1 Tax=Trichoplax adhaerens TaxID=10228 RepID=B3S2N0_TRIAD|nr:hypothetical protein TRIADDRAFT_58085 [Trichoplax adhaerens]EDV23125.1 hypothetical protein TRIADDRAFT_58085 [Trichoplax adhaerens]|eukprot:XP_002114035.1 hypothetical protein TRIADDRAFT_58085 [Trichoplax adhaerens]